MMEGDVLQDDDGMLCGILLKQSLKVRATGGQDHFVSFGALTVTCDGDVSERFLIPEVLEAGDHVGLEVVPSQAKLLLVIHFRFS